MLIRQPPKDPFLDNHVLHVQWRYPLFHQHDKFQNFYKLTGDRIIDVDKTWVFDSNPYVNREDTAEQIIDTKPAWFKYGRNSPVMMSFADSLMSLLGTDKLPWLRHPKFYRYEDEELIPTRIIFHPEGAQNKSTPRVLKYSTIQYILEKYKNFPEMMLNIPNHL